MAEKNGNYQIVLSTRLDTKQITTDLQKIEKLKLNISVNMNEKSLERLRELNKLLNETKALNNFTNGLMNIQKTMQSYEKVASKTLTATKNLSDGLQGIGTKSLKAAGHVKTFGEKVGEAFSKFSLWSIVSGIFYKVVRSIEQLVNTAIELDRSFTELTKVTDLTIKDFDELTQKAYKLGSEVAKTTAEVIDAMTEFAKAGYSVEESSEILAKNALIWTNISDGTIDAAESANMLISVMKAFNLQAEDTTHIIDALNEVSNNYAISSGDLSDSLAKSSAVLANAGVTFEEQLGLITAGTEILRNASTVSTGLRTISLRLQGMEEDGTKVSGLTAKLENNFNNLGLTLYDANGNLKDTFEILADLAEVFPQLNTEQKAYYTELIAGKTRAQVAAAVLNNFDRAVAATGTALDSAGSAARENAKVLDSLNGHIKAFRAEWEALVNSKATQDTLKFLVDLGTAIVKVINALGGLKTALIAAGTALLFFKSSTARAIVVDLAKDFVMLGQNIIFATAHYGKLKAVTIGLSNTFTALQLSVTAVTAALVIGYMALNAYVKHAAEAHDRLDEAFQDAKNRAEEINSKIKDMEDELSQVKKRIEEINKTPLSVVDKEDLVELEKQRGELEKELEIRKDLAKLEREAKSNAAKNAIIGTGSMTEKQLEEIGVAPLTKAAIGNDLISTGWNYGRSKIPVDSSFGITQRIIESNDLLREELKEQERLLDEYKKQANEYAREHNGKTKTAYENRVVRQQKLVDETTDKLQKNTEAMLENYNTLKGYADEIDETDKEYEKYKSALDSLGNKILLLGNEFKVFDDVWDKATEEEIERMKELQKEGNLTISSFTKNFPKLSVYFMDLAQNTDYYFGDIVEELNNRLQETDVFVDKTDNLISGVIEKIKDNAKAYETLSPAIEEYNENGSLSASTLVNLIDKYPEYLKYLDDNGWSIENLNKLLSDNVADMIAQAEAENLLAYQNNVLGISFSNLTYDIAGYTQAISDAKKYTDLYNERKEQIERLKDVYYTEKNKKKSSSSSSKDAWKEEFTKKYNLLKHQREMDEIDEKKYYEELEKLNDQYFKNNSKYEEEYSKYLAEIYKGRKSLFNDYIKDLEHQAELASNRGDDPQSIIEQYKKIQDELHNKAEYYREQHIDENDDLIQELQSQWWQYQKKIETIQKQISDNIKKELDDQLDKVKEKFEGLRDVALDAIEKQIDEKNDWLEEQNKMIDDQIDKLKEETDNMEDQKEIQDKLLKIEEARKKLAEAKNKKVRVYREGRGFVYEQDFDAVSSAQQELDNLLEDWNLFQEKARIDDIISGLEKEKDANKERVNQEISDLNRLKEAWDKSLDLEQDVENYLGWLERIKNSENKNFDERLAAVKTFAESYRNEMALLKEQYELNGLEFKGGNPYATNSGYGYKSYNGVDYNPNTDYQDLINKAVASGAPQDHLAYLEKQRNAKIMGEGITAYSPTYKYTTKESSTPSYSPSAASYVSSSLDSGSSSSWKPEAATDVGAAASSTKSSSKKSSSSSSSKSSGSVIVDVAKSAVNTAVNFFKKITGLADGTVDADGLPHFVGESGPEFYVPPKGSSIIPNNLTSNLMAWGSISPSNLVASFSGGGGTSIEIGNISLPNVTDGESFVEELKNFKNIAIQSQTVRK